MTMTDLPLLNWQPKFDGKTFKADRDTERLSDQLRRVFNFMSDGLWHTLREIGAATGAPEQSTSSRLRDLRKPRFGAYTVERRYDGAGLWSYRVLVRQRTEAADAARSEPSRANPDYP